MFDLLIFIGTVAAISLSAIMVPGPVFAATVAKGIENKNAGVYIALGHGIVEIPLMALLYLGLARIIQSGSVTDAVGLIGGIVLIYLGVNILRKRDEGGSGSDLKRGSLMAGIATTAANPYFFVWWATVGFTLILKSSKFGMIGLVMFASVHLLCDLGWEVFVSRSASGAESVLGDKVRKATFLISSVIMIGFGVWFILSGLGIV
ncbi:hypothetical protein AKJ37_07970 [candidate division MSBL1 archaeon SCGC-AAA259I09]|uniref:Lysine transporter LysE n=2 Tax=candidate division MSBL1 TaxID=215777 RepID=A0A133UIY3_9EURY|nr:hypothetical protein AKJ37_07970 [candidate division MSBL1 archaeon SCGC-AAA259I09]KXA97221.1 hypothetical protein AKJ39_03555 [candidate division MSBL1 archaeon SCGC-AAA259J03]